MRQDSPTQPQISSTMTELEPVSPATRRLCELLVHWPRQVLTSWLMAQPAPAEVLLTPAHPPREQKRKKPWPHFDRLAIKKGPLRDQQMRIVSLVDSQYPQALTFIPDPPLVLFCLGELRIIEKTCVAMVGARQSTTAGKALAQTMATDLAGMDCCIVSGLAVGIDAAAHRGALDADNGATAAVLGAGFEHLYPQEHRRLAQTILQRGGLLLSEYPPTVSPRPHQFPERNRLISGLATTTVLVEAGERSGSLITARLALEQGREVCAVPGSPLNPVAAGCHRLIRQGAALVTCARDVCEELGWQITVPQAKAASGPSVDGSGLSGSAARLMAVLSASALQFDEILALCDESAQQVSQDLIALQLAGFVRQGPDGYIAVP